MKRIIAVLLCLLFAATLFAGCGGKKGNGGSTGDTPTLSKADVKYVDNGASVYTIVRPETDVIEENATASYLFKQLKGALGVSVKNLSDADDGSDKYEILIGNTNRPESKQALDYIKSKNGGRYNDWIICTIGKKIVINAYNGESLHTAAEYFVKNFVKVEGVKGGIEYVSITKGDFVDIKINGADIKDFKVVKPYFNTSYLTQQEIEGLLDMVLQKTGYRCEVVNDTKADAAEYEIIVGNAKRDGVEAISDHDAYKITVKGKKIYINGGSAHATAIAVAEFGKTLEKGTVTDADSVSGTYTQAVASYGNDTFKYAWGDDFDGNALDTTKWRQMNENQHKSEGQHGKTSVRNTDPNYVFVRDGKFHMCATYDENYWYGGMIRTQDIMMYKYGYAEISAIVPHGPSFWVAFWASKATNDPAMSNTDPSIPMWMRPEIDIMEMFGNSTTYAANGHRWPTQKGKDMGYDHTSLDGKQYGQSKKFTHPEPGGRLTDDYHTYGFLWDNTQIAFTCDGKQFFKYDTTQKPEDIECFNHEMYLILSLALGYASQSSDIATATEDEWTKTNKFIIDYCNIYQKNDGLSYIRHLK